MKIRRRYRVFFNGYLFNIIPAFCASVFLVIVSWKMLNISHDWSNDESDIYFIVDEEDVNETKIKLTDNISLLRKEYFNTTHLACHYPKLTIDNPEIWKHLKPVSELRPACEQGSNWVYADNGKRIECFCFLIKMLLLCSYKNIMELLT